MGSHSDSRMISPAGLSWDVCLSHGMCACNPVDTKKKKEGHVNLRLAWTTVQNLGQPVLQSKFEAKQDTLASKTPSQKTTTGDGERGQQLKHLAHKQEVCSSDPRTHTNAIQMQM